MLLRWKVMNIKKDSMKKLHFDLTSPTMWRKTNKTWWYCKIQLGLLLVNGNDALAPKHWLYGCLFFLFHSFFFFFFFFCCLRIYPILLTGILLVNGKWCFGSETLLDDWLSCFSYFILFFFFFLQFAYMILYSTDIYKVFRTIVFIFIVISTTFRPICPPAFFRCSCF